MSERLSVGEEEVKRERSVLLEVLELHPFTLTAVELIHALSCGSSDAFEVEGWDRAIKELCRRGLLRRDGEVVAPTMAAVCFSELLGAP